MAMFGLTKLRIHYPNIRLLLFPTILISILVMLFVILLQNGYQQITKELDGLETARKTEGLLVQKLESLRSIDPGILDKADVTLVALPEKNPANFFLTHVKRLGEENSVSFSKIKIFGHTKPQEKASKADIKLEFSADGIQEIVDFLKEAREVLPVASIDKVEISEEDDIRAVVVTLSVFWSALPTELPPITQPIKSLTETEQELLNELASYTQPEFVILEPGQPTDRENPFN